MATAQGRLNIFFDNEKEEHSAAAQNAIECLQANMTEYIYEVIQEQGAEFRNNYVHMDQMQGRVKVYPDLDQGLPLSPEEVRETFMNLLTEAREGSEIAKEILSEVPNQMAAFAAAGTPDMVIPGYAQQAKTEQDINVLMETSQRKMKVAQAGAPPSPQGDPDVAAAKKALLTDAAGEVQRLQQFSQMPPLGQNGSIAGQVTAASTILNTALKAVSAGS